MSAVTSRDELVEAAARWGLMPGESVAMTKDSDGPWVLWDDAVAMVAAERERIRASIEALPHGWVETGVDDGQGHQEGFEALVRDRVLAAVDAAGEEKPLSGKVLSFEDMPERDAARGETPDA